MVDGDLPLVVVPSFICGEKLTARHYVSTSVYKNKDGKVDFIDRVHALCPIKKFYLLKSIFNITQSNNICCNCL